MTIKLAKRIICNALISYCETDIRSNLKEQARTQRAYNIIMKLVRKGEKIK